MWYVDNSLNTSGTSLVDELDLAPAFLVERFGEPLPGDGYRVTGYYTFTDGQGALFTVYECQSTSAYLEDEDDAPTPEEFWHCREKQELSVGGKGSYRDGSASAFVAWLRDQHHEWKQSNS